MFNKLSAFLRKYRMVQPGDRVICAVSGGADSVALLFGMYLLRQKLGITLEAAHFNHRLRGEESDRDEAFVRELCNRYDIPLHVGSGQVVPGKKGLEAAARGARYGFLKSLPGKIATAHTADDNAETLLMHLVRGTGLKGLGGIAPINGQLIRPMLEITRKEVLGFLEEYHISYVEDSSNSTDQFLRNRLRHRVMPALLEENPRLMENLSGLAQRLREDEQVLSRQAEGAYDIPTLRQMPGALRSRAIADFLKKNCVPEPEVAHINLVEEVVFSQNPSAKADLPGGIKICRRYDRLVREREAIQFATRELTCPGNVELPELGLRVVCTPADTLCDNVDHFCVCTDGSVRIRSRLSGDSMRLPGGTKSLKKIFIDRKIPAADRESIPVIADDRGVVAVYGIGPNRDRLASSLPGVQIRFEKTDSNKGEERV